MFFSRNIYVSSRKKRFDIIFHVKLAKADLKWRYLFKLFRNAKLTLRTCTVVLLIFTCWFDYFNSIIHETTIKLLHVVLSVKLSTKQSKSIYIWLQQFYFKNTISLSIYLDLPKTRIFFMCNKRGSSFSFFYYTFECIEIRW